MLIRVKNKIMYIKPTDENNFFHLKRCYFLIKNYDTKKTFDENTIESKKYIYNTFYQ